jgi:PleD family two-component response regulator
MSMGGLSLSSCYAKIGTRWRMESSMAHRARILIVEDEKDTAESLTVYFEAQGYDTTAVSEGNDALAFIDETLPDLILLDVLLPDIDGFEVCRRLRAHWRTEHIPVIFLTKRRSREEKLMGLELEALDYIVKPYDVQELKLRVRNALRRSTSHRSTNAVTGLPDSRTTEERLIGLLAEQDWAVLYISIDNLEPFIEGYGFVAGYDVLRAVSRMASHVVRELGTPDDFVGHGRGDDLIITTTAEKAPILHDRLWEMFEEAVVYFCPPPAWGQVFAAIGQGAEEDARMVSLSMGVVSGGIFADVRDIIQAAWDVRRRVKTR